MGISFTQEETEAARLERLLEAAYDRGVSVEQLAANFEPGSVGCHEALHMASVFMDSVDRHLAEHPAVLAVPEWFRLAEEASTALFNLYQAIGDRHLAEREGDE